MKNKETKEDIDINIKILLNILKNILDNSYKRKVDTFTNYCYYKVHVLETVRTPEKGSPLGDTSEMSLEKGSHNGDAFWKTVF